MSPQFLALLGFNRAAVLALVGFGPCGLQRHGQVKRGRALQFSFEFYLRFKPQNKPHGHSEERQRYGEFFLWFWPVNEAKINHTTRCHMDDRSEAELSKYCVEFYHRFKLQNKPPQVTRGEAYVALEFLLWIWPDIKAKRNHMATTMLSLSTHHLVPHPAEIAHRQMSQQRNLRRPSLLLNFKNI